MMELTDFNIWVKNKIWNFLRRYYSYPRSLLGNDLPYMTSYIDGPLLLISIILYVYTSTAQL